MTERRWSWALGLVVVGALAASRASSAVGEDAGFSAAHKVTLATLEELRSTLESVKDARSANAAAKKLPELTDRFVAQSKVATGLYIALSEDDKRDAQRAMQEELIDKIKAGKLNPSNDQLSLMVDLSKGPQRGILEKPLTQLRDTLLEQRSIYVPVTARETIAKRLGNKGTPLAR